MTAELLLTGIRKSYRGRGEVLAGIDLELPAGRAASVVGGNGVGKSTLLRIVAGCTAPSAGRVVGRPAVVGYLPAQFPASTQLPVRSYLRHLSAVHGIAADGSRDVLDTLGFTGDPGAPVDRLSTGNAQKAGLAQALGCRAGLVVLDEPWSGLDPAAAAALDGLLEAETR